MRIFCNRHGITVDSDEGLLAEFIYQLCTDDDTYNEFLDLSMTIWIRPPLPFSVAHQHHDKSMATGWPTKPAKLSDRVEANNNLLFETWTSNVAKFDTTKEACDAFRDDLANVRLHSMLFPLPCPFATPPHIFDNLETTDVTVLR